MNTQKLISRVSRRTYILIAITSGFAIALAGGFSHLPTSEANAGSANVGTTTNPGKAMFPAAASPASLVINTIAGTTLGFSGDGGQALAAQLSDPEGIAIAPDGTIYFGDNGNNRIRKIDPAGVITTIAGTGVAGDTGNGGLAIDATLGPLISLALDPASNNLYLSDVNDNTIRRIDLTAGTIHNFAGDISGFSGDGGLAIFARLRRPQGIAVAPDGSVVFTDTNNCRVRRISGGIINTIAGNGVCTTAGEGVSATTASFYFPRRVQVDSNGDIFIADGSLTNHDDPVRRVDASTNLIQTVAGGGTTTPGTGPATSMDLGNIQGMSFDASGDLYIGSLDRVYRVDLTSGILTPYAGTGEFGFGGDGGPPIDATFNGIGGVAFRGDSLVIADGDNNRLRATTSTPQATSHVVSTTADSGTGSLREALFLIQNDLPPNFNTITFNIPASDPRHFYYQNNGVAGTVSQSMIAVTTASDDTQIADIDPDWPHSWFSIQVLSSLPLPFGVFYTVDGYSQPGAEQNTNASGGLNSVLKIEVSSGISGAVTGFYNIFEGAVYRGLIINRFTQNPGITMDVSTGTIVAGCYIGTDPSGTIALGNDVGVLHNPGEASVIGGNLPAARNLISGNRRAGITVWERTANSLIKGNLIGTARDGISPLPNGIFSPSNLSPGIWMIHGPASGTIVGHQIVDNVIAFNGEYGISLGSSGVGAGGSATGNRITQNSIHSNGGIGLNLVSVNQNVDQVTLNDTCDPDTGTMFPNEGQNFPGLSSAQLSGGELTINGTLNSNANGAWTIEFFANAAAESSLHGEGKTYLGSTTVTDGDGDCNASFSTSVTFPMGTGKFITATATDAAGNTSEFSASVESSVACSPLTLTPSGPANGAQHVPFSRTITATGGTGPYSYSLTGQLPAGLSFNTATGEISGTPTEFDAGTLHFFTVNAVDANGCGGSIDLVMTIEAFSCALVANAPTAITGDLTITGSTQTTINLACVVSVTGDLVIANNEQAGELDLGSLTSVGETVNVSGNTAAGVIDLGSLGTTGGTVNISGNTAAGVLDLGSLASVSGNLEITQNPSSGDLDLNALETVSGNLVIGENGDTSVNVASLAEVAGDLDLQTTGSGNLDLSGTNVSGDLDLATAGYGGLEGNTAEGETAIINATAEALMSVLLPTGAFSSPVNFSITHQDPASLDPETGTDPGGQPVMIDPIAAYTFNFTVPTLNQSATLTFEIILDGLDTESRNLLLEGIAGGRSTLATRSDEPGAVWQAFPMCPSGIDPTAGGCVAVEMLDANGEPTTGDPVRVRFTGVTGHFSIWAVAVTAAPTAAPASISGRVTDQQGRGLRGVTVVGQGSDGTVRTAVTNTFGHYRLEGLSAGRSYVLSASSRRYSFENNFRLVDLSSDLADENFVSTP